MEIGNVTSSSLVYLRVGLLLLAMGNSPASYWSTVIDVCVMSSFCFFAVGSILCVYNNSNNNNRKSAGMNIEYAASASK